MASSWHSMSIKRLLEALQTHKNGLNQEQVNQKLQEFGYNELQEKQRTTKLQIFLGQFKDIFVIML